MVSKTWIAIITLILSFIAGIIGMVVLFYPLIALIGLVQLIFYPLNWATGMALSPLIVNAIVFFVIGYFVSKWFQNKFPNINMYFTIPFVLPIVFGLYVAFLFDRGNATSLQILITQIAAWMPLITYVLGLAIFTMRQKRK